MVLNLSIFIFMFLSAETAFAAVDPHFEACRLPQSCGDNQTIRYPFYIQHRQQPFCGYPGFMLKCHPNGHPILHLSGRDYLIHHISYQTHSLRLSDAAISPTSACLPFIHNNLSLPDERFRLAPAQTHLYLVYNCSAAATAELGMNASVCVGNNETGAVVAVKSGGRDLVGVVEKCGRGAAVVAAAVEEGSGGAVEEAVRRGFVVEWTAGECRFCSESGGFCGFDETIHHFKCYCPDRPHAWHCTPG